MIEIPLTKFYSSGESMFGNFVVDVLFLQLAAEYFYGNKVSLLRSRLSHLAFGVIPERFSSSLPLSFASGRFATFLSSRR